MPRAWFHGRMAVPRSWSPRFYERLVLIRKWKHLLPDGALWVGGSFSMRRLSSQRRVHLEAYVCETRRSEICHWAAVACAPLFLPLNPWWGDVITLAYALAANAPCILVQRYNRGRFLRVLANRAGVE
ncbi:MAG: hypothetical protein ACOYMN_10610 [Roseimicrobium sp.]